MDSGPTPPAEPTLKHPAPVQLNAHPYAIKTTSSALLSRSNSTPHSTHHTRHHYVPSSPCRIPTKVRHRSSSSLSSVEGNVDDVDGMRTNPAPLPTPPPIVPILLQDPPVSLKREDETKVLHRTRRAETMPSGINGPIAENHTYNPKGVLSQDQGSRTRWHTHLPPNPKQWNTDQLTAYLETSFKLGDTANRNKDDSSLADVLGYVRAQGLTGRELLRLTDADLVGTPLSNVQRNWLFESSCALRADVLCGRISIDSRHSQKGSDDSSNHSSRSPHLSITSYTIRGASMSADDLHLLPDNDTGEGDSAFLPSPVMSLHRRNSVSDATTQRYRDLARLRMRRRGRVKGLIETWERASTSGSECSTSEPETESGTDPESESPVDVEHSPELSPNSPSHLYNKPHHDICASVMNSAVVPRELSTLNPHPPLAHVHTTLGAVGNEEGEPSIEELLASSSDIPLTGARAWEADFGLGETVKRIPVSTSADAGTPLVTEPDKHRHLKDDYQQAKGDSVRSKGLGLHRNSGSRKKSAKTPKRVVTAIFTGSPTENAGDKVWSGDHHRHTSRLNDIVSGEAAASSHDDPDSTLQVLEGSLAETRAQLEAFRLRLEKVEADTAKQEATLMQVPFSDSFDSPEFKSRRRWAEANVQATSETAEPQRDEMVAPNTEGQENTSLANIARSIVAGVMGWLFPYSRLGAYVPKDRDRSLACTSPRTGVDDMDRPLVQRNGRLSVTRISCGIIWVSFAVCAAVLRRMGFGRWIRRS